MGEPQRKDVELAADEVYRSGMTDPTTPDPLRSLTVREKETLRLLARGHDAKSVARELGLSVHTVNERLRDARQKLRVASSREAARLLADSETAPQSIVDDRLGVAAVAGHVVPNDRRGQGHGLAWFGGGMLVMSLIIAALVFSSVPGGEGPLPVKAPPAEAASSAASASALSWLTLLDQRRWRDSWKAAARIFASQMSAPQWATMAAGVRDPLGKVSGRKMVSATRTASLPGVPPGDYQLVQFATRFAGREVVETVVLAREGAAWKVSGYFVK